MGADSAERSGFQLGMTHILTICGFLITATGGAVGYGALKSDVQHQGERVEKLETLRETDTRESNALRQEFAAMRESVKSVKETVERIDRKLDRREK